jgi:cell division protein FtsX
MREITNSLAQLAAIIMIMITLAVGTAAFSLWANADATTQSEQALPAQSAPVLDVARAPR